jgi:excisionase family DNA binding protein
MSEPELLSLQDVARELGVHSETVRRWVLEGYPVGGQRVRLDGFRAGWRYRIPRQCLDAFLKACNGEAVRALPREEEAQARAGREAEARLRKLLGLPQG